MWRDKRMLSWAGLFAIAGWMVQIWLAGNFGMYASALVIAGILGMVGTGALFVAPFGLLVGQLAAILILAPRYNALEIGVVVAALSMTVLAGLVTRSLFGGPEGPRRE